jgi:pyruvate dehydrogenase E2 component (dihydrolipoamide acetyltransferase)
VANTEIIMPKMGDGMETGTLLSWKKHDGDQVKSGEIIAEIETDKANVEIEAEGAGYFKTQIAEGDSVPVGTVIAIIGESASSASAPAAAQAAPAPKPVTAAASPAPAATPAPSAQTPAPARNGSARLKASPLARRVAAEKGVMLAQLKGTGPNGRIIEADVLAAVTVPQKATVPAPVQSSGVGDVVELSQMRRVIGRRMVESKTQIPHFYLTSEIEMDAALDLRKQLNGYDDSLQKVSLNDFVIKASAIALMKVPDVNRVWQGDKYLQPAGANVGIAVALDDGLIVPVVKDAHAKSLRAIAKEARELIEKARSRKLTPDQYSGGTFTVSNLGSFDIENFIAIIDPSQGAILAVGSVRKLPVVLHDDTVAVRQRMNVTLSGDHRVMDGATGAKFLQELKRVLQNPLAMLER